ncbi:ABC transporter family substrate-binding protein [Nocardia tengchongensis]|uniref:ABC transporter family substrate-binding protein n=1 Tax=Nocardia tengchongensis TaxID=2055889 RepID=UPI00369D99F9
MRIRSIGTKLAVPLVAVALVATGCGGSDDGTAPQGKAELGTTSDINPHDVADLKDGGNLRLVMSAFPANWNTLNIDGNDAEIMGVERSMMPRAFKSDASGNLSVDTNYFTDVQLTNTNPQQVTYTINPKAIWSDGSPITWEDIAAQANALSGRNKEFLIANNSGWDRVEKVERGTDDRQAVLTFNKHFAEWKGQFAGNSFLYPKSVTGTPESFNKGFVDAIGATSGPFIVQSTDRGQGRIVLGHNPKWWGDTPKLDTITFSVLNDAATMPALQNNEIDVVGIGSRDDRKTAENTPGVVIRHAPGNSWSHITFNGAPGSIFADPKLRVAIGKAIDRQGIATAIQTGLVIDPKPLNNHIYMAGQKGYQDNAPAFDPTEAAKELDDLGWKVPASGGIREKDGKKLEIRDVMYQADTWVQMAQIIQQNLASIGVKLTIDTKPGQDYFTKVIQPGDFDMAHWSWIGDLFPLGSIDQIWGYHPDAKDLQGNYGRIGSPELNDLIEKTVSELDPDKAIELANQVDKAVFAEGHSLPLMQSPGNVAVRANLANFGAAGLASLDYTKIGFLK